MGSVFKFDGTEVRVAEYVAGRLYAYSFPRWLKHIALAAFALVVPLRSFGWPQAQSEAHGNRQRASLPVLYRHFFAYQTHLDEVAAALQEQGKDGSEFRDHFQRLLGFTNAEYAPVRASAQHLVARLREHDAKIKSVIDASRARTPRTIRSAADLPPVPQELKDLQTERENIIQHEITTSMQPSGLPKLRSSKKRLRMISPRTSL